MSILMAILLGIVQGVAEFFPVSSSGHLSIIQNLFKLGDGQSSVFFDVLLHLGTFVSICIVYRKDLKAMISDTVDFVRKRSDEEDGDRPVKPSVRMVMLVIAGTLPIIIALPLYGFIEKLFSFTGFIGFALLMNGVILFAADRLAQKGAKNNRTMTMKDAIIIGFAQLVALIPGISRSGTTISVGMSRGLDRDFAVRFSLILSLPAVFGAMLVSLFNAVKQGIVWSDFAALLVGFIIAAAVGVFVIMFLRRIMAKGKFGNFAYYCWGIGALAIILSIIL